MSEISQVKNKHTKIAKTITYFFFPSEELRLHKGCSIQECMKEEKEFPQSLGGNKEKIMSRGTPDSLSQDRNECEERKLPPPPCLEV